MLRKIAAALFATLFLTACWADDGPDDLRYSITSYPGWNIVFFKDYPNSYSGDPYPSIGRAVNSGWDLTLGRDIVRNYRRLDEHPADIRFNIIWYEIDTKKAYRASVKVDARDLGRDPVTSEAGLLIMRISRSGEIQAVTYKEPVDLKNPVPIMLAQECGEPISITDKEMIAEIDRLTGDSLNSESYRISGDRVPSSCE